MSYHNYALRKGLTGFSFLAIGKSSTALPIELMYFQPENNGDQVDLYWATASEINNAFFTIERSTRWNAIR